jgi:ubiquinone/menaquinone biosynthesis C-methylase UbiE
MPENKAEIRNRWESAAPGWAKWEHVLASGLRGATEVMLDMADVRRGMRVLDLACGAGSASMQAAERVGSEGFVVASDISATMLNHVRENATRLGVGNIETLECAVEDLEVGAHLFDAAICRLGLMLFPDPVKASIAVRSVLKPGARFAPLVFTTPSNNLFLSGPMEILLRHAEKESLPPGGPGIFALGASGLLESRMVESGYSDVSTRVVPVKLRLKSAGEALEMMRGAFGNFRAVVAELSEGKRNAAWSEVGEYLKQFEDNSGWTAELEVIIASGMASR